MDVISSRQMPWCTAILGFWKDGQRAWIWPRHSGHGITSGWRHLQSLHSSLSQRPHSLRSLAHGNWWPMLGRRRLLDRSGTVLSCQCFPRRSLLLSSRLRNSEVYFLWRGSCSSETFKCTLVRRVLFMEHLCSTPSSSVQEKVGCRLGPSHRILSISSRPSSPICLLVR